MDDVTLSLRRIRRRVIVQSFVENLAAFSLGAGALFVGILCVQALHGNFAPGQWALLIAAAALLGAALWTALRTASLKNIAARIDARAQTRDRFGTAFSFAGDPAPNAWQSLAITECRRFISTFDARPFTPWRVPRELPWLIVPLVASLLLAWHAQLSQNARRVDPAVKIGVEEKARALEKLAEQLKHDQVADESAAKIADALRHAAAQMRKSGERDGDPNKTALREISALQDALEKMQRAAPPELAALADALQKANAAAADALRRGDPAGAASRIEQDARESEEAAAKMAEALKQATVQLGDKQESELAKAISDAAKAAGSKGDAAQALQKLAEALRRSANSQARTGSGSKAAQQALNALQEMKFGQGSKMSADGKQAGEGAGRGEVSMSDFAPGESADAAAAGSVPSGKPGSERDPGTTETPFGQANKPLQSEHPPADLAGTLGEGESLQTLVNTHGDTSKPAQRYRQLYDAMAPAAEDAVLQEEIPLGSRFFVKRYFQNIRPKE